MRQNNIAYVFRSFKDNHDRAITCVIHIVFHEYNAQNVPKMADFFILPVFLYKVKSSKILLKSSNQANVGLKMFLLK